MGNTSHGNHVGTAEDETV